MEEIIMKNLKTLSPERPGPEFFRGLLVALPISLALWWVILHFVIRFFRSMMAGFY
jgi:hypothetical protein